MATAACLLLLAAPSAAQTRGYVARASGLDLNADGTRGEAGVDDLVCDDTTGTGIQANDIDGDAELEEQIYVDCAAGTDNGTCGGPDNPCLTIGYAMNTRADGNGDGAEDQICFKGTCTPNKVSVGIAGVTGTYSVAASGSQVRAFSYSSDPARLIGWDADNDGSYPPFDADDTAVLDGTGLDYAFDTNTAYWEFAHFTVNDYGQTGVTTAGFTLIASGATNQFYHDIVLDGIMQDQPDRSANIVFDWFGMPDSSSLYLAYENLQITNAGSYAFRGGAGATTGVGPIRIQNVSYTAHGQDSDEATFLKVWQRVEGVELLDSVLDYNVAAWTPSATPYTGVSIAQCTRDFDFINNEMIDWKLAVHVQGSAVGFCDGADARSVDDINIERNLLRDASSVSDTVFVILTDGSGSNLIEDVTIRNNLMLKSAGTLDSCMQHGGESVAAGTLIYSFNTCKSGTATNGIDWTGAVRQNNVEMKNNIFDITGNPVLDISDAPTSWDADYNVFPASSTYVWNSGAATNLATWRTNSGGDANSSECAPTFVSATDLHLAAADSCAQNNGVDVPAVTVDYDGQGRLNPPEIGADELAAGATFSGVVLSGVEVE